MIFGYKPTKKVNRISYQDYVNNLENDIYSDNNIETNDNIGENKENNTPQENVIATYSTSLSGSSDDRINNLKIVCDRLNGFELKPGETFSYNDVTGPFGPDDGFEEAPIMLKDGSKKDGYGGGVCQLSSTLYNVIKVIDGIEITERHHHSKPVSYVPEGEDATISLQSNLDFKFVNNTGYTLKFKAECANNNVSVWAYKVI